MTLRYFSFLFLTFTHFLGVYQSAAAGATVVAVSQVCMQIGRGAGELVGFLLTSRPSARHVIRNELLLIYLEQYEFRKAEMNP